MKIPPYLADTSAKLMTVLDPERAHKTTLKFLKHGFVPTAHLPKNDALAVQVAGLHFPNPVGLAAGFDKNAEVPNQMLKLGFGFVEVGAVTPLPQPGNPSPRVFRLRENRAVINRYGFNNDGLDVITHRLAREHNGIVGINLGANKEATDRVEDYVTGLKALETHVDFCTVNISSPNTPGLRTLQDATALEELLNRVLNARTTSVPVFLKVAPDLTDEDKADIAAVARKVKIDALIVSNTTLMRPPELAPQHAGEAGGLSGAPLFAPSTAILRDFAKTLNGSIPLIGVGGIFSGRDAYKKILNGASLVQLYTALIYEGPGLVARIVNELPDYLQADGFSSIKDAIGADL